MNYINLDPKNLLNEPDIYYDALKVAKGDMEFDYSKILNDTTMYYGWYSPHVMLLAYLVGDLEEDTYEENKLQSKKFSREDEACYWGALVKKGIPEEKAIEMLKIMIELGADLKVKNYYNENLLEWTQQSKNFSNCRINNEKFKEAVRIICQE